MKRKAHFTPHLSDSTETHISGCRIGHSTRFSAAFTADSGTWRWNALSCSSTSPLGCLMWSEDTLFFLLSGSCATLLRCVVVGAALLLFCSSIWVGSVQKIHIWLFTNQPFYFCSPARALLSQEASKHSYFKSILLSELVHWRRICMIYFLGK